MKFNVNEQPNTNNTDEQASPVAGSWRNLHKKIRFKTGPRQNQGSVFYCADWKFKYVCVV